MIYKSTLDLDKGGEIQINYIEAQTPEEALQLQLEWLDDDDVYDWKSCIISHHIEIVEKLPENHRYRQDTLEVYGIYAH
ncbi:hypothetical protein NIES2100_05110 [Calothrix sp. NIES-2100]|uniref:hypothetical protein n=1 Tax=Calothrix sp. NIES-2100 TaxID=1954172 RepID=UPI000B5FFA0E|nr:hypothetical protein NIES2100_05110 [Calothrix sp. NIES-2100]